MVFFFRNGDTVQDCEWGRDIGFREEVAYWPLTVMGRQKVRNSPARVPRSFLRILTQMAVCDTTTSRLGVLGTFR